MGEADRYYAALRTGGLPRALGATRQLQATLDGGTMPQNLSANKQNAVNFYRTAYLGDPAAAVEMYVGDEYIQHNPLVGNGKHAFVEYFTEMAVRYPDKRIEFVRAVAEDNLVALHTHQVWPGNEEYVTMDFFRFDENGKIVEHWDSIQEVPDETKNGNAMY
ncbi:nuclear transport factor 2 family protein [Marinobacter sp. 2_MG-2023]|uniref:nuclear transport factor 2 family protein n=1 Tax=Marinobacter sp. 2_MG-2023 TaxID=3062679 RepID=UPI0026E28B85|nr:nuclear transport factor 2 family protein [Marinobacter sp. 2_MG-2023]MDO6441704.1 nuclear transport factor 2 family protein [Marinobacter sp. 2_MG-2023]